MVFNALFDRAQRRWAFRRNLAARAVHALLFEIGLLLAIVPLAAWWLDMGLWQAFVLDIGIALFFMPYSFVFNWVYDKLSARLVARQVRQNRLEKSQHPAISGQISGQASCDPAPAERF